MIVERWNLNNKEGWIRFNEEFPQKYGENSPKTQKEINKLITDTMEKTIGKTKFKIGNKRQKESYTTKILRNKMNKLKKTYEKAIKKKDPNLSITQDEYFTAYKNMKNNIENEMKEETEKPNEKLLLFHFISFRV